MAIINEILQKNLDYIKKYDTELCEKLCEIDALDQNIQLIYTEKNEANIAIDGFPINEQTGAEIEAKRIVASLNHNDKCSMHIVIGLGFGYLFNEIVETSNGMVILYEPNIMLLRVALEMVDMSNLLSRDNVLVTDNINTLEKYFHSCFLLHTKTSVLGCHYYRMNKEKGLNELVKVLNKWQGMNEVNDKQRAAIGAEYVLMICNNLNTLKNCRSMSELENSLKDYPAIIASAGPSLGENLDIIKKYRDKFVLFGVSSSFGTLMKNGITPDYNSIIERADDTGLVKDYPLDKISLIAEPYLNSNVLNLPFKEKIITSSLENTANNIYNKMFNIPSYYFETKGTVAYNALFSAMYMGCNPIILVGQDLAYVDNECYSKNSPLSAYKCRKIDDKWEVYLSDYEKFKNTMYSHTGKDEKTIATEIEKRLKSLNREIINAKTVTGKETATTISYALFAEYYKLFSKKYENKIKLYTVSDKGLDLGDFKYSELEPLLKNLPSIQQINKNKTNISYQENSQLLKIEISYIEDVLNGISSARGNFFKLQKLLSYKNINFEQCLLLVEKLLTTYININKKYIDKSIFYNELTQGSKYEMSNLLAGAKKIDIETIKQTREKFNVFFEKEYNHFSKALEILKKVKENFDNESNITKS